MFSCGTWARLFGLSFALLGLTELFRVRFLWDHQHQLVVFVMFVFCLTHSASEWGLSSAVWFLTFVCVSVTVAEGLFDKTLFGDYQFTLDCTLGPHILFGKPLFVPVAWYVVSLFAKKKKTQQ
jgi:uncharacterized membrane protein